jgi:hypothetical protein
VSLINARSFANIADMSDQRVSGNRSSQWHNYSGLPPSQTGNNSVPSFSQRASASQFGELASGRQAVPHPPTLQRGMVSGSSTGWLLAYRNSRDPDEGALAAAVTQAIQDSSLALGNPASQTTTRAQYGQRLVTPHGTFSLLANFRTRPDGGFDLVSAGMRDSANPDRKVMIRAPQNADTSGQAQPIPNPAPLPPSAPPPAQTPQFPVHHPGTPVAGPSSRPLQPAIAPPAFSKEISRGIRQIVNGLLRWEQQTARNQIETRLHAAPADEQQILLMHLNAQLSGKAGDTKPAIIQNWAATASVARATAGSDIRTDRERELQDALAAQLNDPAFRRPRDEILGMLPLLERRSAGGISSDGSRNYRSVLYRRVFSDRRGPVAAINDIRDLIAPLHEQQRYQAIKDWVPR